MSFNSSRSANSGKQSKRSAASNQSSSGDGGGKKRKENQKTLGMAWGANSRSSSRSSFRSAPFSDFGSYMEVKNRKLQDQFAAEACNTTSKDGDAGKPIFQGVAIFVDGFTIPSSQELRLYMLKHGGRFENYFSRHRVTHIICSNLPDSKIKNLRAFSGGLPVVKPTWVLDSVAADKLLSWVPYQIDQLTSASRNQPKLSAFFTSKNSPANVDENSGHEANCYDVPEIEESTSKSCLPNVGSTSESRELKQTIVKCDEGDGLAPVNYPEGMPVLYTGKPAESGSAACNICTEIVSDSLEKTDNISTEIVSDSLEKTDEPEKLSSGSCPIESKTLEGSPSMSTEPSKYGHSTLEDPNFVENYFKSSRLHFIGAWRTRYRKHFQSLPNGTKSKNSNPISSTIPKKTVVIHVDMDSFFVSVVIRKLPELRDKPVAICHSDNPRGTAEISSANYPARDFGIRAGIFVRDAKGLCPHLVILPYNFEEYQEVADQFYNILHKHCNNVQAVSCDEAFLEVPYMADNDPEVLASVIRQEIWETTGCTASAGIGSNMLMARLATKTAKPNGQCHIRPEVVDDYLLKLPIKSLPGIGHVLEEKLKKQHIKTCGQLRAISKETLQRDFGTKTGEMLWNYSRGVDNRLVGNFQESKSVGAEINWGVRFRDLKDTWHFLEDLCREVSLRLQGCGMCGRTFTLKLKKRKKDAMEPAKFMGHGDCENLSHSTTVPVATDDVEIMQRIIKQLFGLFSVDVQEIRGVGFQVSKLESGDIIGRGNERNSLHSWLTTASTMPTKKNDDNSNQTGVRTGLSEHQSVINLFNGEDRRNQVPQLPPLSLVDMEVIENLPQDILTEMDKMYNGRLFDFIAKKRGVEGRSAPLSHMMCGNEGLVIHAAQQDSNHTVSESRSSIVAPNVPISDFLPISLSQVDPLVLQELPEDVRVDILKALPGHRASSSAANAALPPIRDHRDITSLSDADDDRPSTFEDMLPNENMWKGNPPRWVEKFRCSQCPILRKVSELHGTGPTFILSLVLQKLISRCQQFEAHSCEGLDEGISDFSDLLRHYIDLKIEKDLEEIHICFRLLKRCASNSDVFQQIYDTSIPYLQVSVVEKYGGNLQI
uniref:DNA repair protein REV1 n=1 Tax=Kalanchoe fedtschenkoi TaxID=63787 RepID=A0A7N0TNI1_KALFE